MYEEHFELTELPFRISPDPRFLYLSPQHKETLAKALYMVQNNVGPLYVTGPIGSGKTTVARTIYQQLSDTPKMKVAFIIAPNLKTANAFLREIMNEFDVKTERSYTGSLKNFSEFLMAQHKAGISLVLLIDEAQNLPYDALKLIHYFLNYETNVEKLLRIVLFGQALLDYKIEQFAELKSRMFPSALAALSPIETSAMIQFRWQIAGGKEHPFDQEAISEIYRVSLGLPREICKLCDLALLRAFNDSRKSVDKDTVTAAAEELNLKEEEK
jgi:general secretion pathway protein A